MAEQNNPFKSLHDAQEQFSKELMSLFNRIDELEARIKPFISGDDKTAEIMKEINLLKIVFPMSFLVIGTCQIAQIEALRLYTKSIIPPDKMRCPKCQEVVWDMTEIHKQFVRDNQ